MMTKRCLFCDSPVPVKVGSGPAERFIGCDCAPGADYGMTADQYEVLGSLSYPRQRELFPLASAYIREMTGLGRDVVVTAEEVEALPASPHVPLTVEAKCAKLLAYLRRQCAGPGEPVIVHRLARSFNLTYSQNLQEMVYVIEKLRDEELLERTGSVFSLTPKGWEQAELAAAGGLQKYCVVAGSGDDEADAEWTGYVLPLLQQCGYTPRVLGRDGDADGERPLELLARADLVLAELSGDAASACLAGGYALAAGIPLLWTSRQGAAAPPAWTGAAALRWQDAEELSSLLLQRLRSDAALAAAPGA
ncbi:hypothetical protein HGI30_11770 [Paenibacillus albicereus]|uniref:Uncharacterized protein n=1 Tax=Paenibacillus albicereus TaxID=2726185 RepID=A0A6H2GYB3_9BACL|nr:hypothetical protein [Paenibacillus albicereus]QJC52166.1 hypothetical protein HGI30_11770 [Paenibacillus albicereus]